MRSRLLGYVCFLAVVSVCLGHAEIPQMISYQGKVAYPTGEPIPDGVYAMEFVIWDADTGGSSLWSSGVQPVDVNASIFSVVLGQPPQLIIELPFDADYWLEVIVEGDVQSPRKRLTSIGYAYMASGIVPGTEVIGEVLTDTKAAIKGTNLATTGIGRGVFGQSHSDQGRGVWGWATSTTGINVGVLGETASSQGWGVWGWATATNGDAWGVFGQTDSETGRGVFGYAKATTGENIGVYGRSRSPEGTAIYGEATSAIGNTVGIHGTTSSSDGIGIKGVASATEGNAMGVLGEVVSTMGHAVQGNATATSGCADGVYGMSASTDGKGIHGEATATSGWADGVFGRTASSEGHGIFGWASETTGGGIGVGAQTDAPYGKAVVGEATATTGGTWGVGGWNYAPDCGGVYGYAGSSWGQVYGVMGQSASTQGTGVYGTANATTDTTYGVWGESFSPEGRGVYGLASSSTGSTIGILGETRTTDYSVSYGVYGRSDSNSQDTFGVFGTHGQSPFWIPGYGAGVMGFSHVGAGVVGWTETTYGSNNCAIWGEAETTADNASGVFASCYSPTGYGVYGQDLATTGECYGGYFWTGSDEGYGVYGETGATDVSVYSPCGVLGKGGTGIHGESNTESGNGVVGTASGINSYGIYGESDTGYAGCFNGDVTVSGDITAGGTKSFLIDHPLDPANKSLAHACIESDLPVNLYRGTALLDARGEARVRLPDWFETINADYAYYLTPIGAPAPDLYIAQEIDGNEFRIAGGVPGLKVSWMVTAERDDAWVRAHPYVTEREKAEFERGYYIAPELFGRTADRNIARAKEQLPTVPLKPASPETRGPRMRAVATGD